jgi:hypothetical protein
VCGRQRPSRLGGCQRPASEESMPIALETPARAKAGHEGVAAPRLDAQRNRIAIGTAVALGKDEIEEHRCCDAPKYEEASEHNRKNRQLGHMCSLFGDRGRDPSSCQRVMCGILSATIVPRRAPRTRRTQRHRRDGQCRSPRQRRAVLPRFPAHACWERRSRLDRKSFPLLPPG